jgi:menaquinone-9 beta-reductase
MADGRAVERTAMPHRACLRQIKVAGPCHGYANSDVWLDRITAPGVVLIGDAAGTNDPSIAQGLSLSFRDVRLVGDALAAGFTKSADGLAAYVGERRRRMSRYRLLGHLVGRIRFEFADEAHARRQRIAARMATEPDLAFPMLAQTKGYEAVPEHVFTEEYREWVLR